MNQVLDPESRTQQSGNVSLNQKTANSPIPRYTGDAARRELDNSLVHLKGVAKDVSKHIDLRNEQLSQAHVDIRIANHFRSIDLEATGPNSKVELRNAIQAAAAKTEVDLINLWAKRRDAALNISEKTPDGKENPQSAVVTIRNWLKGKGFENGEFPTDTNILLGGWKDKLNYKGQNKGLLEEFHTYWKTIENVKGSCPIQLLAECRGYLRTIPPFPQPKEPSVIPEPPKPEEPKKEPEQPKIKTNLVDVGTIGDLNAANSTEVMQKNPVAFEAVAPGTFGDLKANARSGIKLAPLLAGFISASPIGHAIDNCIKGCLDPAGLGGGGVGHGGPTGGSSF